MKTDIEKANAAKQAILARYGAVLDACNLILTDKGFMIEIAFRQDVKVPATAKALIEFNGVPVTVSR